MAVQENTKPLCSKKVSGVEMNLSAGELNLVKGQQTYIDVKITGLQNLPSPATLTLNNITTEVVIMRPSNSIIIPLAPDSVGNGIFNRRFDITSIKAGGFTVIVNLDLPEVMMDPLPGNNPNPGPNGKCICSITAWPAMEYTTNYGRKFGAAIVRDCGGQNCSEKNIVKEWQFESGADNGDIVSVNQQKGFIIVKPKIPVSLFSNFQLPLPAMTGHPVHL